MQSNVCYLTELFSTESPLFPLIFPSLVAETKRRIFELWNILTLCDASERFKSFIVIR